MTKLQEPVDAALGQQIAAVLERLSNSKDVDVDPLEVLEIALAMASTAIGTLHPLRRRKRLSGNCCQPKISRAMPSTLFGHRARDTNTTCEVALTRRMRVFVEVMSRRVTSSVGTREKLDFLRASGIAAIVSTPLISSKGRFLGVVSVHFQKPKVESEFDLASLDQFADNLERREDLVPSRHFRGKPQFADNRKAEDICHLAARTKGLPALPDHRGDKKDFPINPPTEPSCVSGRRSRGRKGKG